MDQILNALRLEIRCRAVASNFADPNAVEDRHQRSCYAVKNGFHVTGFPPNILSFEQMVCVSARFLLDWCVSHGNGTSEIRSQLTLTHEEIAQIIGASRETVTRILAAFKKKDFLQIKGSTLIIRNKSALENFIDSRE